MNPIISGYMKDFKKNIMGVEDGSGDHSENIDFEHFINYLIVKKDFSDDFDYNRIHVGGKGDFGIDGLAIIIDREIFDFEMEELKNLINKRKDFIIDFVFIQSKTSEHLDSKELLYFLNKIYDFFKSPKINGNNKTNHLFEIKNYLYSKSILFASNPRLHIKYVYNGKKNKKDYEYIVSKIEQRLSDINMFSAVNIDIIDANDIQNIYKEITLNMEKNIVIDKITTLSQIENIQESYIGIISLEEFIKLISGEDGKIIKNLFYDNVRDYQGTTKVNIGIKDTLIEESNHFGLFHNGITIVSKNLNRTGNNFKLKNFQIINGCQTSHVIMLHKDKIEKDKLKSVFIPIKLIVSQDENILTKIIVTANTHNEIKKEAFESLDKFHKGLEDFYISKHSCMKHKYYYERRSKQYFSNSEIQRSDIVTLAEQIYSFLSMFNGVPQSTHRYYGELLNVYKESVGMFKAKDGKEFFELYHIAGIALKKLNYFIYKNLINHKYKAYRYHILFLSKKIVSYKLSRRLNNKEYQKECKKMYQLLENDNKLLEVFKKSCECIDSVLKQEEIYNPTRKKEFTSILNEIKF